ncbi:MAG: hypothetical protein KJ902_04985 [Candidatus Omnitrophica bacterium]|nr:hypothetical protein [Candidatus Omnitrophota bacterium]
MTKFKTLFGIKETDVKNTCLLLPLIKKDMLHGLCIERLSRGRLYASGNNSSFTIIHTGVGAGLLGDAALYLENTKCQNIIVFGSCGLVDEIDNLNIGSLVSPSLSYSLESFTEMLSGYSKWESHKPDKKLLEYLINNKVKKVTCASLGSLKLEEGYIDIFKEKNIDVADMECAALFSAVRCIKKKAAALFYVTDIINKKPFYRNLTTEDQRILSLSIKSAINILCKLTEENLKD